MYNIIFPLTVTILIEFLIFYLILKQKPLILLFYSVIINTLTLPVATYFYLVVYHNFILIEVLVVIIEAILIKFLLEISYKKAILVSLVANFTTAMVGLLIGIF